MAKAIAPEVTELSAEEQLAAIAQLAAEELSAEIRELLKRNGLKRAIIDRKSMVVTFDSALIERLLAADESAYIIII